MRLRVWLGLLCAGSAALGQTLNLPPRATNAPSGSALAQRLAPLTLESREQELFVQAAAGNVPDFLRKLRPVSVTNIAEGVTNMATFFVTPDYLALGSDADYFLTPLTPVAAQRIADLVGCSLPTRKMVNAIYAAAQVKLPPAPMPPGPQMTTVTEFAKHDGIVETQRTESLKSAPLGALVAGDKKDVVITARLAQSPGKVAIYGWHQTNGAPIQPLYLGHTAAWADYSHGIRLVSQTVLVNGQPHTLGKVLADVALAGLLSDEGPFTCVRYDTNAIPTSARSTAVGDASAKTGFTLADFKTTGQFEERTLSFVLDPGVKVHINVPKELPRDREMLLIYYALPNGNTTAQTIGKQMQPGDDWHFDIQHIGAQTRWLRQHAPERSIVVAYLEADTKSWPAWRKQHGDARIPALLDVVRRILGEFKVRTVLTGHSGGGSLTFGYLNAVGAIPDDVERIAFLDSNYAYERERHEAKLVNWLKASTNHFVCVLAYQDYVALLDGKPFVSEHGGTWGRSQAMLTGLGAQFSFSSTTNGLLIAESALHGRIGFLLRENPERKIYHTVQVEKNGFIHAMLSGTPRESVGYSYLGERVYTALVSPD